jgi:REP element-mobilizing transposase RayT
VRLHGDERGTVDNDHNAYGAPFVPPNFRYENLRRSELAEEPLILGAALRGVIDASLQQHAEFRKWHLHAWNVRTNHVHVVVAAKDDPGKMMGQFKAYGTRALADAKLLDARTHVWTPRGSKKWLFTDQHARDCCNYVWYGQGDDLAMG